MFTLHFSRFIRLTFSLEKKKAGGLIIFCPSCSEETTVKYAGVQSADGKGAQASILKFQSEKDRSRYIAFWQNNSGLFNIYSGRFSLFQST